MSFVVQRNSRNTVYFFSPAVVKILLNENAGRAGFSFFNFMILKLNRSRFSACSVALLRKKHKKSLAKPLGLSKGPLQDLVTWFGTDYAGM